MVIVGNGPIKDEGCVIDSFKDVCRIHQGINHLNHDVGFRTTIFAARREKFKTKEFLHNKPKLITWFFTRKDRYGCSYFPTTGMLCIKRALQETSPVYITGFNLCKGGYYWDEEGCSGTGHRMDLEAKLLNQLIKEGLVKWI